MKAMVVGATAGVGRALSEALAARGSALLLVARDMRDLKVLAAHLRIVYHVEVQTAAADATNVPEFVDRIRRSTVDFDGVDSVFFPIGVSHPNDLGLLDLSKASSILATNLVVVMGVIAELLPGLLKQPRANIVGFSSVAAVRGRSKNVVYSAAKRGLESYFESLRHFTNTTNVRVQLYRLGYVATQQSFGQRLLFPVVTPQQVARMVLNNLHHDIGCKFFPHFWIWISFVVSCLPWWIYKKLNF